jgi:altronate hydrolase
VTAGFKVAARNIAKGEPIRKYNVVIGFASADIVAGSLVHSHNMEFREFDRDYAYAQDYRPVDLLPEHKRATFMGIVRANGQIATRNYVGVLSTVNCSATVAHKIAEWFTPERLAEYPNIDGVVAFAHGLGCGMEMTVQRIPRLAPRWTSSCNTAARRSSPRRRRSMVSSTRSPAARARETSARS